MYVVRLGWQASAKNDPSGCCATPERAGPLETTTPELRTGSLHDELLNPGPTPVSTAATMVSSPEQEPSVSESRPCYRCIQYMDSVGIKRVFWTTREGKWEGAKVRELVDALDDLGAEGMMDAHTTLSSVFVTKHEILMLMRTMGKGFWDCI